MSLNVDVSQVKNDKTVCFRGEGDAIPLMARWERDTYAITVDGVMYESIDGDLWIDAKTRLAAAPEGAITLVGGPRHGETVA